MSNRFTAPSAEELAARGLNPDGTLMEKADAPATAEKPASQKASAKKDV